MVEVDSEDVESSGLAEEEGSPLSLVMEMRVGALEEVRRIGSTTIVPQPTRAREDRTRRRRCFIVIIVPWVKCPTDNDSTPALSRRCLSGITHTHKRVSST